MASRDIRLDLDTKQTIVPQSIGGAVSGTSVDLQGCEAALVILSNGAATTPATVKIQEAPDNAGSPGSYTDVADTDLIGITGNTSGVAQTASTIVKVSYIGAQRFIRVATTAGTAALFDAVVVRGHLRHAGGVPV
jgi:hypothetical protein